MSDYSPPLASINAQFAHLIPLDELVNLRGCAHLDVPTIEAVLREAGRFTSEVVSPLNRIGDRVGSRLEDGRVVTPPGFKNAYLQFAADGWIGLDLPIEYGGQAMPRVLQVAVAEMVNGACVSFGMLPLMQRAAAKLLIAHATPALRDLYVRRLASGEFGATIAMSEAEAGSDIGRVSTRAERQGDGTYAITGTKIFITYGDHDLTDHIVHIVLARVHGAPEGVRGLSVFAVPASRLDSAGNPSEANRISVSRVEKKMGLKASPTCVLNFDRAGGQIIGQEGEGLRNIFTMLSTMRIEVAVQGVAIASAATIKAIRYALTRRQGNSPARNGGTIVEHPDVRRMLMTMKARTDAMRGLVYEAAYQLDLAEAATSEIERINAQALAEWLLPVCKACGSETGFDVANLGVQVHGGHGYITDTGAEQYVRDSRVMSIYEGTNGIQASDLLARRLTHEEGRGFRQFVERIRRDLAKQDEPETMYIRTTVQQELTRLEHCSNWMALQLTSKPRDVMAGATAYLNLVGLVGGGWMWLRMARIPGDDQPVRRALARFYADNLMSAGASLAAQALAGSANLDALTTDDWARLA